MVAISMTFLSVLTAGGESSPEHRDWSNGIQLMLVIGYGLVGAEKLVLAHTR